MPAVAATPGSGSLTAPLSGTVSTSWTGSVIPGAGNVPGVANFRHHLLDGAEEPAVSGATAVGSAI
jgi:hypothetical protein